jgi:hypothetical protein
MKIRLITEPPLLVAANDDWCIHRCEDAYGQLHLFHTWVDPDEIWGEAMNRTSQRALEHTLKERQRLGLPPPQRVAHTARQISHVAGSLPESDRRAGARAPGLGADAHPRLKKAALTEGHPRPF